MKVRSGFALATVALGCMTLSATAMPVRGVMQSFEERMMCCTQGAVTSEVVPSNKCKIIQDVVDIFPVHISCNVAGCEDVGGACGIFGEGDRGQFCTRVGEGWNTAACDGCGCGWKSRSG